MTPYTDKYHLTPEQSRFLAKKKWDENVYCGMKMENRAVTFPQTKTILEGVNVPQVHLDDIQAILNMRDAWRYMLQTTEEPLTLEYICKLNDFVARNEALEWGTLRTGRVSISGTDYIPPVPQQEAVRELYPFSDKWNKEIVPRLAALLEEYSQSIDLFHMAFPTDWEEQLMK